MAPRRWTTEQEYTFLNNLYPQYLQAQKEGNQDPFFVRVEREWFKEFSEHKKVFGQEITILTPEQQTQLGVAISARQKQLREWFRNRNASARRSGAAPTKPSFNMTIATKPTGRRRLKSLELYSRKYYHTRVQPAVKNIIMEQSLSSRETLRVIKELTAKTFEEEDDEIKAEIQAEYEAQQVTQNEDAEEASEALPTPMQRQAVIDSTPAMLKDFLSELSQKTGWCFSVIGGGPCPEEDGEIRTISYHHGQTQIEHNFGQVMPDFKQSVMKPYISFLKEIFPAEVRATFSLSAPSDSSSRSLSRSPLHSPSRSESPIGLSETEETLAAIATQIEIGNSEQESPSTSSHVAPQAAASLPPELGHQSLPVPREASPLPAIVNPPSSSVVSVSSQEKQPSSTESSSTANAPTATATVNSMEMSTDAYSNASGIWSSQPLMSQWDTSNVGALTGISNVHPLMRSSDSLFYDIGLSTMNVSMDGLPEVDLDIPNLAIPPSFFPAAPALIQPPFTASSLQQSGGPILSSSQQSPPFPANVATGLMVQSAGCAGPLTMVEQHVQERSPEAIPVHQDEQGPSIDASVAVPIEPLIHPTPVPTLSRPSHVADHVEEPAAPSLKESRPKRVSKKPTRADATPPWQQNTLPSIESQQTGRKRQVISEKENNGRARKKGKTK